MYGYDLQHKWHLKILWKSLEPLGRVNSKDFLNVASSKNSFIGVSICSAVQTYNLR